MDKKNGTKRIPKFLGIEGGGTHTTAVYKVGDRIETEVFGCGNLYLLTDEKLRGLFEEIHRRFTEADCVVAGMAGARNESDFQKIRSILESLWVGTECIGTNDLEVGIANTQSGEGIAKILLIAGTGSCAYGKSPDGKVVKVGAWGHVFGDWGSAYEAGLMALKLVAMDYDDTGKLCPLGEKIFCALSLKTADDLISWAKGASKSDIGGLAKIVFEMAGKGDDVALQIVDGLIDNLHRLTITCAKRVLNDKRQVVEILLNGGLFEHNKWFEGLYKEKVRKELSRANIVNIAGTSHIGAVKLAENYYQKACVTKERGDAREVLLSKKEVESKNITEQDFWLRHLPVSTELSPTELPNPLSKNLDTMPVEHAVRLFLQEDAKIPDAIMPFAKEIASAVELVANSFKQGGRLIYVGAGTSGRIAMLDAAECPPTFGVPPGMVEAIIAGGYEALRRSIEGAEDDFFAGQTEIHNRNVDSRDFVVGIAASGTTKFVWGALSAAKKRGAKTMLLCFNPKLRIPDEVVPNIVICPNTGAELLTGSTRLKAGTATKMILNIISTLSMARIGRIKGNLMLKMLPTNEKLRRRAIRIVSQSANVSSEKAKELLEKTKWDIQSAIEEAQRLAR